MTGDIKYRLTGRRLRPAKVVQRVPVRIDFDRAGQDFNAEGLPKPGLSVVPDVRVR